mgnify:CR=1 FL=1
MTTTLQMFERVKRAWQPIAAPPATDMTAMEWGWGEEAAVAFTEVKPTDVDIDSPGFRAATPLFDLPNSAAAAYLGTYLLSLLKQLDFQEKVGLPTDFTTRAHTLTCLTDTDFWDDVIRAHLPKPCLEAVTEVARLLVEKRELLALEQDEVETLIAMAGPR